jgi:ADP-ribose pyrophosphatase YjhB (NUDIX family)
MFPPGTLTLTMMAKAVFQPTIFGATGIVEDAKGHVLLVRHSYKSGWGLPGGGVQQGEPPDQAVLRELKEEVGLVRSLSPEFFGLYTRKVAWFTNVVALYRLRDAQILFKPNLEIHEAQFFDPSAPPGGASSATRRRLAELTGQAPRSPYW